MRKSLRLAAVPLMLVLGLSVASAGAEDAAPFVDFRMAPLEQVKKINDHLVARNGAGETMTVMNWDGKGDGQHLIVPDGAASPATVRDWFSGAHADSVSWFAHSVAPLGTCDSQKECEEKTDEMCKDAGHTGVRKVSVTITVHADGSKTCSGDCESNGAIAFVTCNPQ